MPTVKLRSEKAWIISEVATICATPAMVTRSRKLQEMDGTWRPVNRTRNASAPSASGAP